MNRHQDWEVRLVEYVVPLMGADFQFGRLDCALFASGAVQAMTGADLARGYRGYRSMATGLRKLREAGHEDHIALAASLLEEVPVAMAHRGDIAVVEGDEGPALGVVQGEMIYVLRPSGGVGLVFLTDALRAFRVPFPAAE